jgi:hypothetical protein
VRLHQRVGVEESTFASIIRIVRSHLVRSLRRGWRDAGAPPVAAHAGAPARSSTVRHRGSPPEQLVAPGERNERHARPCTTAGRPLARRQHRMARGKRRSPARDAAGRGTSRGMSKHASPFVLVVLVAAAGACGESKPSKDLRGAWAELQLPGAEHAEIQRQPSERDPGFRVAYKGLTAYYGLCQEYVAALEPLGFRKVDERQGSQNAWVAIELAKGGQTWRLSCQHFEADGYTTVDTKLLSPAQAGRRPGAPGGA